MVAQIMFGRQVQESDEIGFDGQNINTATWNTMVLHHAINTVTGKLGDTEDEGPPRMFKSHTMTVSCKRTRARLLAAEFPIT
jgi:hypothetical protein